MQLNNQIHNFDDAGKWLLTCFRTKKDSEIGAYLFNEESKQVPVLTITKCQHIVSLTSLEILKKKSICSTCHKSIKMKQCVLIDNDLKSMLDDVKFFLGTAEKLQVPKTPLTKKELRQERNACKMRIIKKIKETPHFGIVNGKLIDEIITTLYSSSYPYPKGERAPWLGYLPVNEFCEEIEAESGVHISCCYGSSTGDSFVAFKVTIVGSLT